MEITIPHHPESERAVIGMCLLNGAECVEEVMNANTAGLFHDARHYEIWSRLERLHKRGKPVDMPMVLKEKVESEIDATFLNELLDQALPAGFLRQYLGIALDYQKRRTVINAAMDLLANAQRDDRKIDEAIEQAETAMFSLQSTAREEKTIKQGLARVLDSWEHAQQNPNQLTGIPSGIYDLDKLTWGFQCEDLVIIGARPSQGKTALLGTIAVHCALSLKIPTLLFSLESSMESILRRIICGHGRLNSSSLRAGQFTEGDFAKITTAQLLIHKSPLYIIDQGSLTINQIRSIARRYVKRNGIKIILVDYLQKVKTSIKSEKRTYEVGNVSEGLKEMAKELGLPVIAACQLNRENEKDKGRPPRPSDLGDSGMIERDADIIALLHKLPEQKHADFLDYFLLLGKHRDGETKAVPLRYFPTYTKFENVSYDQEPDYADR